MKLSIISFTNNGIVLSEKIAGILKDWEIVLYTKCTKRQAAEEDVVAVIQVTASVSQWAGEQLREKNALLFIGACGIAVRAIAPHLADKLHDSPVLVMDEKGSFVIPLIAGHVGGANALARMLAQTINAQAVITTATDLNQAFAVDLFAEKNGLRIVNKEGIARVSSKILAYQNISISIEPGHFCESDSLPKGVELVLYPPAKHVDVVITSENKVFDAALLLQPKEYVIGMGCRKGKEAEAIEGLIARSMKAVGISAEQVFALASVELKKEEQGFLSWSRKANVPFLTYSAEQLRQVEGTFHSSAFVREQTGVDNVCERAALLCCELADEKAGSLSGRLVLEKQAQDGMTIAIAKREWSVRFDEA